MQRRVYTRLTGFAGLLGKRQLPVVAVAVVGAALSVFAFFQLRGLESSNISDQFKISSQRRIEAIRAEVASAIAVVEALRSLFDASGHVSRDEFAVGAAHHIDRQSDVQMLAWLPRMTEANREEYETGAREDGMEKFQIVNRSGLGRPARADPRDEYYPVYFVEPYLGNETNLGWDLASDPTLAKDLILAGDLNQVVVTTRVLGPSSATRKRAFAAFVPVYQSGTLLYSVNLRRKNLRGFILGTFSYADIVEESFELLGLDDMEIRISDVSVPDSPVPLCQRTLSAHLNDSGAVASHSLLDSGLNWELILEVGTSRWLVECTATREFARSRYSWMPWWAIVGGLLFTVMFTAWVSSLIGRNAQVRALVGRRTLALRASEAKLKAAADAANAATRAKSEFLANMSHEIRTPMTAILGFTETMLDPNQPDSERLSAIHTVHRNGEHLLQLVNDILDLSKIEAGKLVVEHIRCSPVQIVNQVTSLMQVRADAKNLSFNFEPVGSIPETIESDPTRLKQILVNLAGNAVKFTEVGEVRLITRFVPSEVEPKVQFDVVDTGIGMTEDQLGGLFTAFSQADTSTTRKFGGTGLGLNISKRLCEILGGDITVESKPGVGSMFRVTMPTGSLANVKILDNATTLASMQPKAITQSKQAETNLDCHILLAEDGMDNQRLIAHVLRKAGADVTVKENGKLAAEAALAAQDKGRPFDVILMDMQMPVMDGYEATHYLRQKGYTAPIIALTAHAMASDRRKCLDAGCDDYASKPIDRKRLIDAVRNHADAARSANMAV